MPHKLKLDEKGAVVVQDGNPVYIAEDGKDIVFDYDATLGTIGRLRSEAKGHREAKESAETKLKAFEGIEDPAKALKALETVKNLDDKKLIDAGEVERIKQEAGKGYDEKLRAVEEKYKPVIGERDSYKDALHREIIGGAFSRSKFIADKVAIPADLVQSKFGTSFTISEDNKIVAKDASGNQIYSRANPGNIADFDEALQSIIEAYPYKDSILKGSGASGGGAGGNGGGHGGKRTVTRAAFDAMVPADKVATAKAAKANELVIVD
jgi:hypothetical protein